MRMDLDLFQTWTVDRPPRWPSRKCNYIRKNIYWFTITCAHHKTSLSTQRHRGGFRTWSNTENTHRSSRRSPGSRADTWTRGERFGQRDLCYQETSRESRRRRARCRKSHENTNPECKWLQRRSSGTDPSPQTKQECPPWGPSRCPLFCLEHW